MCDKLSLTVLLVNFINWQAEAYRTTLGQLYLATQLIGLLRGKLNATLRAVVGGYRFYEAVFAINKLVTLVARRRHFIGL